MGQFSAARQAGQPPRAPSTPRSDRFNEVISLAAVISVVDLKLMTQYAPVAAAATTPRKRIRFSRSANRPENLRVCLAFGAILLAYGIVMRRVE
jgi:hypothetical protein